MIDFKNASHCTLSLTDFILFWTHFCLFSCVGNEESEEKCQHFLDKNLLALCLHVSGHLTVYLLTDFHSMDQSDCFNS